MRKSLLVLGLLLFCVITGQAQERTVSGKVTSSEDGSPLPGVNVVVKGTTIGTSTDSNGNYSIEISGLQNVLVFTFIGLQTQEVQIGSRTQIDVSMQSDVAQLTEVIVTGYREESKRSLTGSIAQVSSKAIQNIPIASVDQILQGRAAGVLVLAGSGQPGSSAQVSIRGNGSLSGGTSPLYVLDGVPIEGGRFNSLNANDYEFVNILKDASATSIYGSRAANGVIILRSKRGKSGKTSFNYNSQYGISYAPQNKLELMNSKEKIDYELYIGGTALEDLTSEEIDDLRKIETDWQDVLTQDGKTQSHEFSAQGGNENTTFYISGNYFSQEGSVIQSKLDRYTTRINLTHQKDRFNFGFNSTFGYSKNVGTNESNTLIAAPLNAIRWTNPYETPYDSAGNYTAVRTGQPNGLQEIQDNFRGFNDVKAVASLYAEYSIPFVEGLSIKSTWGIDYSQRNRTTYFDRTTYAGSQAVGTDGSLFRQFSYIANFVGTTTLNFNRTFNDLHEVTAGIYYEIQPSQTEDINFTGYGITGNLKNEAGITVSDVYLPAVGGSASKRGLEAYFMDAKYGYNQKYYAKFSFRRDGSSRLGEDNKYGTFYSAGANWIVSEESFFQDLTRTINSLKVNASIGTSGNQEGLGDFQSLELYGSGFQYDGGAGVRQTQLANPALSWERQNLFDAGFELTAFNNRLTTTVSFYNRLTKDLLLPFPVSRTTGFTTIIQNIGKMRNRGIELSIDYDVVRTKDFRWNVNANFTQNNNEVLDTGTPTGLFDDQSRLYAVIKEGEPLGANYHVEYVGVNPANGDALYRKLDGSITNQWNASDLKVNGTRIAPRFGGFTNTLTYKGFEFSVFFTWVQGNKIHNNDRTNVENPTYYVDNLAKSMTRIWKQPGDITDIPNPDNLFQDQTTRYLENGAYLRLRNVMVSYSLPQSVLSTIKLNSVKVYAQGQNLWTRTEFLGWDPEIPTGELRGAQFPALRSITFGLNVGF
jgi:TonB-dependent starch-binding outer membrane protein SusC